jgi:hypothetical protein
VGIEQSGFAGLFPSRRGEPFEVVRVARERCKTAREDWTWRQVRISERSKALKVKSTRVFSGRNKPEEVEERGERSISDLSFRIQIRICYAKPGSLKA